MADNLKEQYQDLFDLHFNLKQSGHCFFVIDRHGNYIYMSPASEKICGFTPREFVNHHYNEFVHSDDRVILKEYFERSTDPINNLEVLYYRIRDKEDTWTYVKNSYLRTTFKGEVVFACVGYDVNEVKRTNDAFCALKNISLQYKNVLDSMSIVSITNTDGLITYVNENYCKLSQFSRDELVGKDHKLSNSGTHPKEFFAELWNCIKANKSWSGEVCNKAKDGSLYWVDTRIIPIANAQGEVYQYMSVRFDITELKTRRIAEEEERASGITTSKLVALGEMAATLAHEINNPLTIIQYFSKKLSRSSNSLVMEQGEKICNASKRISTIMHGLKMISRNSDRDEAEWFGLNELVDKTVGFCNSRFSRTGVDFSSEGIGSEIQVFGKISDLSQVLLNLINNAIDAVEGCKKPWIKISYELFAQHVRVIVTDSGTGIPFADRQKIMTPFYTTKKIGKGTGLGLSLSRKIVSKHDGKLYLEEGCKNTCFVVELPAKIVESVVRSA